MKIDLEKLSRGELVQLRADVDAALETLADRERKAALEAAKEAARAHGFDLDELTSGVASKSRSRSKSKNPPKYRNPSDPKQTWTGRGRRPNWIKEAEAAGTDIAEFAI